MIDTSSPAPVSGVSHVDALQPGARLAEFEILSLLGVGGFGMVYKAFDHSLHRAVAIKEYMPSALAGRAQEQSLWVRSPSDEPAFRAGLASFVGEARLLAQFDHPSLVKVFRFWEANNTAYMVMPLYSGMTFKQARAQMRTPPSEAWLRKVLWSVLDALRVLHGGNTLHRDISPDNIFLQDNGPPVLLDLGAARHAINDQDRRHTAVLKVNYAPIEQYAEGDLELRQGPWSDLYSLAAVVHGCLCNDTPLPATLRSIRDRMVPFSRVAKTVKRQFGVEYSAPFVTAISQSLALRPEERPQNIDTFLQLMEMTSAPDEMLHFDFRAELGDIWVEPADQPGPGLPTPTVDVISAAGIVAEIQARSQAAARVTAPVAAAVAPQAAAPMPPPPPPPPENRAAPAVPTAPAVPDVDLGGDTVLLAGPEALAGDAGDTVFIDAGDTVVAGDDSRYDEPPAPRSPEGGGGAARPFARESQPSRAPRKAGARRTPLVGWLAVAVCVVVAAAAGVRFTQGPRKPPRDDIITELAQPPAAPAAVAAGEGEALRPAAATAAEAASGVAAGTAAPAASVPVPAFVVASGTRPAPRPSKRVASEPAAAPVVEAAPEPAPPPPPPPPPPKPAPAPPRVPTPQEACADSSFIARPMCIHQECQKPSQAGQPICVENRRRYEAEEQRRRQTPN